MNTGQLPSAGMARRSSTITARRCSRVRSWSPFHASTSAADAAHNAVILEYVARMASHTLSINAESRPLARELHDKHFLRKHGRNAYYGQVRT